MEGEIDWERAGYESRSDLRADDIGAFVATVLNTINVDAARGSARQWGAGTLGAIDTGKPESLPVPPKGT